MTIITRSPDELSIEPDSSDGNRAAGGRRLRRSPFKTNWITYVVLIATVVLSIFPLYWMFVVGSNDTSAINDFPPRLTPGSNFRLLASEVFGRTQFGRALINSFIVASLVALGQVLFSTMAGFAFAKLRFPGRNLLMVIVIITMMIPPQLGVIPLFIVISDLGWASTLQAVVAPSVVSAFGVFWMRQLIDGTVPDELIEAAKIDGASTFRVYRSIVMPLVRPGAAVLGLFAFMFAWNDFFWPLIALSKPESHTVQVALRQLQNQAYTTDFGVQMNGTFIATVPLLLIFLVLGRQIVAGVMEGALK